MNKTVSNGIDHVRELVTSLVAYNSPREDNIREKPIATIISRLCVWATPTREMQGVCAHWAHARPNAPLIRSELTAEEVSNLVKQLPILTKDCSSKDLQEITNYLLKEPSLSLIFKIAATPSQWEAPDGLRKAAFDFASQIRELKQRIEDNDASAAESARGAAATISPNAKQADTALLSALALRKVTAAEIRTQPATRQKPQV